MRFKKQTKHVEVGKEDIADRGSTPLTSTNSYCGTPGVWMK